MNVAQEILNLILKMMYHEDFKSSFTSKEKSFVHELQMSSLKYFRISTLYERRTIFTWESAIGESVACHVGEEGFHLSQTVAYKSSTKRMKDKDDEKLSPERQRLLDKEIDELKTIFRTHFPEVEPYLK